MSQLLDCLSAIADRYDALVFDQWGVLHNGDVPYAGAVDVLKSLHSHGHTLAVLSNSGKRSATNARRIEKMGFPAEWFQVILTSGEALWQDIYRGEVIERLFFPIEQRTGDAENWKGSLDIQLTDLPLSQAVLLMGLPDDVNPQDRNGLVRNITDSGIPVYCSNPDEMSPRKGDSRVFSPGYLARQLQAGGTPVVFYGKPYATVFQRLEKIIQGKKILMIGDSPEHDILGAHSAGWDSLFIQSGLYAPKFATGDAADALQSLFASKHIPLPTYYMKTLR